MNNHQQLSLFPDLPPESLSTDLKTARSGSFVDNMALPVHRWFRYSAGFSAEWVKQILGDWELDARHLVLDPFAGSGTVPLTCESLGIKSVGVEAHPMVARIGRTKLLWTASVESFQDLAEQIQSEARRVSTAPRAYPSLIERSFSPEALAKLDALKAAWECLADQSPASELVWLALTATLRTSASAGTAQWQYILPNKTKKKIVPPDLAFRQQVELMAFDMVWMQSRFAASKARILGGDARTCADLLDPASVDAVITSPPYANNYDYADALRFEMTFWGEVSSWGEIHDKVRKHLIVSSSQHSSKEGLTLDELLASPLVDPIRDTLAEVVHELAVRRENHGGKKHYHTMVAAYCRDIAAVLISLRQVCRSGAKMCWVIGDSAPYGVYCPIDQWIGDLALGAGFASYEFEKLRDRNTKWKNRKHRVPLKEGLLWIEG